MNTPCIVVTGGVGTLARALREHWPHAVYLDRRDCDVRDYGAVHAALEHSTPDVVVHAAAITDHQHPNAADLIETNIGGTEHVARWCRIMGARLVYLSTHYVYGPNAPDGGWRESDFTAPIGAYAWSKFAGERWVEELCPDALIVRGSWYSWASRVKAWTERGVIADAWVSREHVCRSAHKIAALVAAGATGTFNIGGPRRTFAEIVNAGYGWVEYVPVTRAFVSKSLPYPFPRDVSVNTEKFDALGLAL